MQRHLFVIRGVELDVVGWRPTIRGECENATEIQSWLSTFGRGAIEVALSGVTFFDAAALNAFSNSSGSSVGPCGSSSLARRCGSASPPSDRSLRHHRRHRPPTTTGHCSRNPTGRRAAAYGAKSGPPRGAPTTARDGCRKSCANASTDEGTALTAHAVGAATRPGYCLGSVAPTLYNVAMDRESERQKSRRRAARRHQGPNHWHVEKRSSVVVCQACGDISATPRAANRMSNLWCRAGALRTRPHCSGGGGFASGPRRRRDLNRDPVSIRCGRCDTREPRTRFRRPVTA
jgi:hypothetical protein